jgi:hypothetical protein
MRSSGWNPRTNLSSSKVLEDENSEPVGVDPSEALKDIKNRRDNKDDKDKKRI